MMHHVVTYGYHAWTVAQVGTTVSFNLPRTRPLNALGIRLCLTTTAALAEGCPESLLTRIVLRAGKDVIIDLDGHEAYRLSSILGVNAAYKNLSAVTNPIATIVLPFGEAYALDTRGYPQVTLDLTFALLATRVAATCPTGHIWIFGIEQDTPPTGVTRRFLRQEHAIAAAGDADHEMARAETYRGLMVTTYTTFNTSVVLKNDARITNVALMTDSEGLRIRPIDTTFLILKEAGLYSEALMQFEAADATVFNLEFGGTAWISMMGSGNAPMDASSYSRMQLRVTQIAAGTLSIVRDVLV